MTEIDVRPAYPPIERDLECYKCKYNLRSLRMDGLCPECGAEIAESFYRDRLRGEPVPAPDEGWGRTICQGATLAMTVAGLLLLAAIVPSDWFDLPFRLAPLSRTPGRIALLVIACNWWALNWAAAWKLTTSERLPNRPQEISFLALATRILCSAYMVTPFLWAAETWEHDYASGGPLAYVLYSVYTGGFIGGFLLVVRIGRLFLRIGRRVDAILAWILAPVTAGAFTLLSPLTYGDPSSLSLMFYLPAYPFGIPEIYLGIAHWPRMWAEPIAWAAIAHAIGVGYLLVRLRQGYAGFGKVR